MAVHRRQLAEIDDLAARGLLPEGEVSAARAEAGRRLLAAAETPVGGPATAGGQRLVLVVAALIPLTAVALYWTGGSPGAPDQPFHKRLAEWRHSDPSTLDPPRMAALMRAIVVERPKDPEAFKNLALAELASGDAMAASGALRRAVAIAPNRADLWAALGETFMAEGDGRVGADARAAFTQALRVDPASLSARYFLARADIADGKVEQGLAAWRALLASLPADDSSRAALAGEIDAVTRAGGLPETRQAAPVQPDAAQIRGMVEGLDKRLGTNTDDPQGWVRLVRAWSVLGETAKRDAALANARALYKGRPDILKALDEAAQ